MTFSSPSSSQNVSIGRKLDEWHLQLRILLRQRGNFSERERALEESIGEYNYISKTFGAGPLAGRKAFEIGCGQRPYRLAKLLAHGVDVNGVDMDFVFLQMSIGSVYQSWRDNGLERTAKTVFRHFLVDQRENEHLANLLGKSSESFPEALAARIKRSNAANENAWPYDEVDFIYSEDVFEHIALDDVERVCRLIRDRLTDSGVALVRPMVFTGIKGGHNVEWYHAAEGVERRCPPWDHLLENRYPANTYLNRMWLSQYREVFREYLEIVDEAVQDPELGGWAMTNELRSRLAEYPDEELFSNRMRFIMRKKR